MIHFEDWEKLDLRVGKIKKVEDHPKADKLYVLTVDFGKEIGKRTIIAGLKQECTKEHLQGKSAIFIVNLEPRKLKGIESQGMILAADVDGTPTLLHPEKEIPPGSTIT